MKNVNYFNSTAPEEYRCSICGIHGYKLWRQYHTMSAHIHLMCADCAQRDQKVSFEIDEKGLHIDAKYNFKCDQIGWLIPAVPDEEGYSFWSYSAIPDAGIIWWSNLPTHPKRMV